YRYTAAGLTPRRRSRWPARAPQVPLGLSPLWLDGRHPGRASPGEQDWEYHAVPATVPGTGDHPGGPELWRERDRGAPPGADPRPAHPRRAAGPERPCRLLLLP